MTKARDTANLVATGVPNSLITLDAAEIPNISTDKLTTGTLANARVADLPTSKITSGTFADARISASSVTAHVSATDLQPLKSDLTALALREATNEASAAFNLPNQFIDTFTDDTNLGTQTDGDRTSGYWATIYTGSPTHQANTEGDTGGGNIGGMATTDMASAITQSQDGISNGGILYTTGSSVTGYLMLGLGASYTVSQIDLGKYRGWGDPRSVTLTYGTGSTSSSSADSTVNLTSTTATVTHYTGANSAVLLSNFSSSGTADWSAAAANGTGVINRLTGFTPFTMRWIRIKWNSADFHDANASWSECKLYVTPSVANATGTLIQSANAVGGSDRTKVGGTMLYKDNAGTATIGTDLKIYFSCNNGGAWTEAASYNVITPVYSTGIKQVRLGETTCTAGTGIIYKAVWANQAASSKETQLHGIGINY